MQCSTREPECRQEGAAAAAAPHTTASCHYGSNPSKRFRRRRREPCVRCVPLRVGVLFTPFCPQRLAADCLVAAETGCVCVSCYCTAGCVFAVAPSHHPSSVLCPCVPVEERAAQGCI
eukprot:TRINITY_DN26416_c0_g1_i3.p2 TRINITY_DN26416_c0_g1~~TRINITY_DN26416_c0_g1_i3.p2  ORF type:complete len:118 (+),score=1.85 TRINITY_DN26416_c0_g1_i3:102-455(+)